MLWVMGKTPSTCFGGYGETRCGRVNTGACNRERHKLCVLHSLSASFGWAFFFETLTTTSVPSRHRMRIELVCGALPRGNACHVLRYRCLCCESAGKGERGHVLGCFSRPEGLRRCCSAPLLTLCFLSAGERCPLEPGSTLLGPLTQTTRGTATHLPGTSDKSGWGSLRPLEVWRLPRCLVAAHSGRAFHNWSASSLSPYFVLEVLGLWSSDEI